MLRYSVILERSVDVVVHRFMVVIMSIAVFEASGKPLSVPQVATGIDGDSSNTPALALGWL